MKSINRVFLVSLIALSMLLASPSWAQTKTPKAPQKPAASSNASPQEKNIQEYIDLLRVDVRQQKAEIMGAMMVLSAGDAAKFWPIYSDYEVELNKLNDLRVANINEYARTYPDMTDEKADQLIQSTLTYQRERSELLGKTYNRVKQALGATTAARFVQVEHQLLLIIDLQIASSLPIIGSGS